VPNTTNDIKLEAKGERGRPSKYTPEVVTKLVAAFNMGFNDSEAAAYAGISRKTFYEYMCDKPDFRNRINRAKIEPTIKAKEIIVNALNKGDVSAAKWWLERKAADEFSTKPTVGAKIPAELHENLDVLNTLVHITERQICYFYRVVIYRLREQERANTQRGRGAAKTSLKDDTYTQLLKLSDSDLASHIEHEVSATGEDIAGVRELLKSWWSWKFERDELFDKAKDWNDVDEI
jgi:hypothetical protein